MCTYRVAPILTCAMTPSPNAPAIPCAMTPSPNARTYPWKLDPRPYTQRRRLPDILGHLSAAQLCLYDHGSRNLSATSKRHVSPLSAAKATVPSRKDLCSRNTASTSTTMVEGPGTNFPFTCASTPFLRSLCHDHTCVIACVMTTSNLTGTIHVLCMNNCVGRDIFCYLLAAHMCL